jgi:hypothetical protein
MEEPYGLGLTQPNGEAISTKVFLDSQNRQPNAQSISSMKDNIPEERKTTMVEEVETPYNAMGQSFEQMLSNIKDQLIPDDGKQYSITFANKPEEHYVEISITRAAVSAEEQPKQVANINVAHDVLQTTGGIFDLSDQWDGVVNCEPGFANA